MVPPNLAASTPLRLSRRFTAQGGLVECVDDRHGRRPPSPSQCSRPSQLCRREMHRSEPALPLRGGALVTNQRPPQRHSSLLRVPAGPVPSARSRVWGRGRRRRCPPVATPNPIASTTPLIGRLQRRSRRRRRRAAVVVDNHASPGMPLRYQRASIHFGGVPGRCARARAAVLRIQGRAGRVRRRPARAFPLPFLNGADRGGSAVPPRIAASQHPGGALVTNQRRPRGTARCYASRRRRFRRPDLTSGEEDDHVDDRRLRLRIRLRRCRR